MCSKKRSFLSLLVLAALVASAAPAFAAPGFPSAVTIKMTTDSVKFREPVAACLKFCTEIVLERQTFECSPVYAPPYSGCDLPWIDPDNPNGLPEGIEDQCIPEQGELAGYLLSEKRERIQRNVVHRNDCTSTVTETLLQNLPRLNNNTRPCPDPGPWGQENERWISIRFRACP